MYKKLATSLFAPAFPRRLLSSSPWFSPFPPLPSLETYLRNPDLLPRNQNITPTLINPSYITRTYKDLDGIFSAIGHARELKDIIVLQPERMAFHFLGIAVSLNFSVEQDRDYVEIFKHLAPKIDLKMQEQRPSLNKVLDNIRDQVILADKQSSLSADLLQIKKLVAPSLEDKGMSPAIHELASMILIDDLSKNILRSRIYNLVLDTLSREIKENNRSEFSNFMRLAQHKKDQRMMHIIAGGSATGKSTLAKQFIAALDAETSMSINDFALISTDRFRSLLLDDPSLATLGNDLGKRTDFTHDEASLMHDLALKILQMQMNESLTGPHVLIETVFPKKKIMDLSAAFSKTSMSLTSCSSEKAIHNNEARYQQDHQRFTASEIVLAGQKKISSHLPDIFKQHKHRALDIRVYHSKKMIELNNNNALIAHFDCVNNRIYVKDIKELLHFIQRSQLNIKAKDAETLYAGADTSIESLMNQFKQIFSETEILFVDPLTEKEKSLSENTYATFTAQGQLLIHKDSIFERIRLEDEKAFSFFTFLADIKDRNDQQTQLIRKKDSTDNMNLRMLCLSGNPYIVTEYHQALTDTYGVRVFSEHPPAELVCQVFAKDETNNPVIQKILTQTKIPTPHFIVYEENKLFNAITGEEIKTNTAFNYHLVPLINHARLHVWKPFWNEDGTLNKISYKHYEHGIKGYMDTLRRPTKGQGFGWDSIFVNSATGQTYAEDSVHLGKISARQLVLDDFITGYLFYRSPKDLKHIKCSPKKVIDFDISVSCFIKESSLSNPFIKEWGLHNLLEHQLNYGLFFKAAINRPLKNYFTPPFSGIPLTAKKTGDEETIFMFHDLCHHALPDLIFDGTHSLGHKYVYAAWRMISEAVAMILADMLYAESLEKSGANPAHLDQRIYPLFQALHLSTATQENRRTSLIQLLEANTAYAVLGDDSLFKSMLKPGKEDKLEAFKQHFSPFFIGDYSWTHTNYENMLKNRSYHAGWSKMVGSAQFKRAHVLLLSDMVDNLKKRGCRFTDFKDVVQHTFQEAITKQILPMFDAVKPLTEKERVSNAFHRYMIGLSSFYAKYHSVSGIAERGTTLIKALRETEYFDAINQQELLDQYKKDVYHVWGKRLITTAMMANICQLHPIFPPVYISYARPQYPSIAAAQKALYEDQVPLSIPECKKPENYVRVLDGITFIDALALEKSIAADIPAKDRLQQKMIHAGVVFWDQKQTIIKTPVIGISSIGGFSVCFDEDLPSNHLYFSMGENKLGPFTPRALRDALKDTMGMQAFHTYMNPQGKTASELFDTSMKHQHYSIAHSVSLGLYILGISKKAELEFDVQRDKLHLARETSARTAAQDEPTLVALTAEGAAISEEIRKSTSKILTLFKTNAPAKNWREERNALYPLSAAVSLGINGSLRNLGKIIAADVSDDGKEIEYRNALKMIGQILNALVPEMKVPVPVGSDKPKL